MNHLWNTRNIKTSKFATNASRSKSVTDGRTNGWTNWVTSSLLELLIADKNKMINKIFNIHIRAGRSHSPFPCPFPRFKSTKYLDLELFLYKKYSLDPIFFTKFFLPKIFFEAKGAWPKIIFSKKLAPIRLLEGIWEKKKEVENFQYVGWGLWSKIYYCRPARLGLL